MPKSGKDTVLILQVEDKAKGDKGCIVGSLTETKHAIENDLADEQTKFGRVLSLWANIRVTRVYLLW